MDYSFYEAHKNDYLLPIEIEEKDVLFWDLYNIENSFSGRMDTPYANTFIMESVKLAVNAISLFEMGYFDCAYYSLRQSIEVATTLIYLSDLDENLRKEKLNNWKELSWFPMQNQMLNFLSNNGQIFANMKDCLNEYFDNVNCFSKELNKYVHKQGFQNFYVFRNHGLNKNKFDIDKFKSDFINNLSRCIGVIAVMRLAIDPYPVLLMDYDIYSRTFDSMTEAYSEDFVNKYIGKEVIEKYKQTEIFRNHYESIIIEEQKNPTVLSIVKHQYIDTTKTNDIMSQLHLLDKWDYYSTLLAINFAKATKIYCCGGIQMFFTDRNTNRKDQSWNSKDFKEFSSSKNRFNQKYGEAFISVVCLEEDYYLEHNEILSTNEINILQDFEIKVKESLDNKSNL